MIKNSLKTAGRIFSDLSPNIRVMMISEPFWAVPTSWITVYLPVYMFTLGLKETQIGWVNFFVVIGQITGISLGGYLADHWGRKKTVMTFDFTCWFGTMLGWLLAGFLHAPYWAFCLLALNWGFGMIVMPAWYCLFTEGASPNQTRNGFSLLWLILSANGIFAPLGGLLVKCFGVVRAYQVMMGICIITVGIGWTYRLIKIKETTHSVRLPHTDLRESLKNHWEAGLWGWKQPLCRVLLFSGLLHAFYAVLWNCFLTVYWTDSRGLQLSSSLISVIPAIASLSTCMVILFLLPRLKKRSGVQVLLGGAFFIGLGMFFMVMTPPKTWSWLFLYAIVFSGGVGIYNPIRDTLFLVSLIHADYRAKILAIGNLITLVAVLPVSPIGGYLYHLSPRFPFLLCLSLAGLNILLLLHFEWEHRKAQKLESTKGTI